MKSVFGSFRTAALVLPVVALMPALAVAGERCVIDVDYTNTAVVTGVGDPVAVTGTTGQQFSSAVTDTNFLVNPPIGGNFTTKDLGQAAAGELFGDADLVTTTGQFLSKLPDAVNVVGYNNVTTGTAVATITPDFGGASAPGANAFACGPNAQANGDNATALGNSAVANGNDATAVGQNAEANGENATALGQGSQAHGADATAVGENAHAHGENATAIGQEAEAFGQNATAVGENSDARGRNATALGQDANALGTNALAIGQDANADGNRATAIGQGSLAVGNAATAVGQGAEARNNGTAVGTGARALDFGATAVGDTAFATEFGTAVGDDSVAQRDGVAMGNGADALRNATAVGREAQATGNGSVALGKDSRARGEGSVAIGREAEANADGSVAIGRDAQGNGAVSNNQNEFVLGTANHTYTAPGITSGASRAAQSGPLEVVTTDSNGHLASDGGQIFNTLSEFGAGIAIAMSLENPDLVGNERFGIAANLGFFEGNTALGVSLMGVLGHNFVGGGERWALSGGVGVSLDDNDFGGRSAGTTVAGRAGVQVSW
jgi:hypothetical protein